MNLHTRTEIAVGTFVLVGLAGLAYLSVSIGGLEWGLDRMPLEARFASVGDLKAGAAVKLAGVKVGTVDRVGLDDYAALVHLRVDRDVALPEDTIASIRTEGLLGESYVLLRPGGAEANLEPGDRLAQTEPAIDLIDLLVDYALSGGGSEGADSGGSDAATPPDPFGD
ncbi:MAG TPA: outer membrane lipid asymmetry maintenance protein MlaD [Myxococcales bacterium LLY-WYZ-16_1]|nr:outer membrane lipid asymmetry maintenance protein MlaD [Myxococcales bacterium LLY-WYZ-16_1]